jgi:hypothetical protein
MILKMTLKAQYLEIGKDIIIVKLNLINRISIKITEIARYATAFGAGFLPAHTYYTTSRS